MKRRKQSGALVRLAESRLMEQLPVDQKALRRAAFLLEPKNLKRLGVLAAGGAVSLSVLGTVSRTRMLRAAMARELKKQLAPVNKKLDELEKQNEELKKQNEQLRKQLR